MFKNTLVLILAAALMLASVHKGYGPADPQDTGSTSDAETSVQPSQEDETEEVPYELTEYGYRTEHFLFAFTEDGTTLELKKVRDKKIRKAAVPASVAGIEVTAIGEEAFYECSELREVFLPDGLKEIGRRAFLGCVKLTEVRFPETLETIGYWAFNGCVSLKRVQLPDSVKSIGDHAFYIRWGHFDYFRWPAGIPEYNDLWGFPSYMPSFLSTDCEWLEIPEGVQSLEMSSLEGRHLARNIILPASITSFYMGLGSFRPLEACSVYYHGTQEDFQRVKWNNAQRGMVYYYSEDPPETAGRFWHEAGGKPEVWPMDDHKIGFILAEDGSGYSVGQVPGAELGDLVIPSEYNGLPVKWIENFAFRGRSDLTSVTIPDTVESIGRYAFMECDALEEIRVPGSVKTIGEYAFAYDKSLKRIIFEEGVEKISGYIVRGSDQLKILDLPESSGNQRILAEAFTNDHLDSVVIPKSADVYFARYLDTEHGIYASLFTEISRHVALLENYTRTFYKGTEEEWNAVWKRCEEHGLLEYNGGTLLNYPVYFYSAERPEEPGSYWHYVDGDPVIWDSGT